MCLKYSYFLFVFYCANGVLSHPLLPLCKGDDGACIEKFIQDSFPKILVGVPELDVQGVDPLSIEKIKSNILNLNYVLFNTTTTGLKNCVVSNLKLSSDLVHLHYDVFCPELHMEGKYELNGQIGTFPIEGKGDYSLISGKQKLDVNCELKQFVGEDGKTHLSVESFKVTCQSLSSTKYDFKNLYNGNKELSDAAHKYAHENWKEVQALVQTPLWYSYSESVYEQANKYFKKVALEDIKDE